VIVMHFIEMSRPPCPIKPRERAEAALAVRPDQVFVARGQPLAGPADRGPLRSPKLRTQRAA